MTTAAVLKMKNKALHSKNCKSCTHVFLAIFYDARHNQFTSVVK